VDDRSRIASLESELRLLPDLQKKTATSAALEVDSETLRSDLTKLKAELDCLNDAVMVSAKESKRPGAWSSFKQWLAEALVER
jgi:hypothetical protein